MKSIWCLIGLHAWIPYELRKEQRETLEAIQGRRAGLSKEDNDQACDRPGCCAVSLRADKAIERIRAETIARQRHSAARDAALTAARNKAIAARSGAEPGRLSLAPEASVGGELSNPEVPTTKVMDS